MGGPLPPEIIGAFMAVGVGFFFATGAVIARVGLVHVPAGTGSLVTIVVGWVPITVISAVLYPKLVFTLPATAYLWMALTGAVNFPVARFLNMASLKILGVGKSTPILATAPLYAAFVGVVFLAETMTWPIALGTIVLVSGVVFVVQSSMPKTTSAVPAKPIAEDSEGLAPSSTFLGFPRIVVIGYVLGFGSAMAYGVVPATYQVAMSYTHDPFATGSVTLFFGSIFMAMLVGPRIGADLRISPRRSLLFVGAGGLSMTVGTILFFLAVERTPVIVVSPLMSLQPVFALAGAHFFLQRLEKITLPLVLGTLIIVGGVLAITFGIET